MNKKISFKYKGKKVEVEARVCEGLDSGRGLMFRFRNTKALLFELNSLGNMALTALFVFFPFVAVFLDGSKVVDLRIIRPFVPVIKSRKSFTRVVEIPISKRYRHQIELLVGKQKV